MARYCKSCGSVSKAEIPHFIVFIAAFIEKSVFLSFYIAHADIIPTDTPAPGTRSLYPAAHMCGAG